MKDEVVGFKLHEMKGVSAIFMIFTVSYVLVTNAVKFVDLSNHHECDASKHLGDKEEGLKNEPDFNTGSSGGCFLDVLDDEPKII